jgi:hypothetical protein
MNMIDTEKYQPARQNMKFVTRKYQPAVPEYEAWWRVGEANESQTSYSVEQADIFQYQSYSYSDDMFIILKSNISTTPMQIQSPLYYWHSV